MHKLTSLVLLGQPLACWADATAQPILLSGGAAHNVIQLPACQAFFAEAGLRCDPMKSVANNNPQSMDALPQWETRRPAAANTIDQTLDVEWQQLQKDAALCLNQVQDSLAATQSLEKKTTDGAAARSVSSAKAAGADLAPSPNGVNGVDAQKNLQTSSDQMGAASAAYGQCANQAEETDTAARKAVIWSQNCGQKSTIASEGLDANSKQKLPVAVSDQRAQQNDLAKIQKDTQVFTQLYQDALQLNSGLRTLARDCESESAVAASTSMAEKQAATTSLEQFKSDAHQIAILNLPVAPTSAAGAVPANSADSPSTMPIYHAEVPTAAPAAPACVAGSACASRRAEATGAVPKALRPQSLP